MSQNQLTPDALSHLRKRLLGGEPFMELATGFIDALAARCNDVEDVRDGAAECIKAYYQAFTQENAWEVEKLAESPIEKTFLHSLMLSFIKSGTLGLLVYPTYDDTPKEVADFRSYLSRFFEFRAWLKEHRPADTMEQFLNHVLEQGGISQDEHDHIIHYMIPRYYYFPMDTTYHMTLQPRFPGIKIDGKEIRPDIYFWIPSRPDINVIVECDGFNYHSDKARFKADRQRDRALKALGYDVLRFSGSEIYNDPINAPYELATYLWRRSGDLKS
jgi:hypothetical protein